MLEFIKKWREKYNFVHRNCSDFVLLTLEAAGFRVKWWLLKERYTDPTYPAWLFDILKQGSYDVN